jgi:RloB-like protein
MSKKKRTARRSILIACEGSATEFTYFERLREEIEEEGIWAITVYPDRDAPEDRNPKTSALQLVEMAKSRASDYDEVCVVFDKDGYLLHADVFELALSDRQGKKIHIAFSSIAFEQWVLAHFERLNAPFLKSECRRGKKPIGCGTDQHPEDCKGEACACGRLRTRQYLPDYGKSADYDLYPKIRQRIPIAICNAAWLRYKHRSSHAPIHELNPYTDVDVLIKRLLGIDLQVAWVGLEELIELDGLAFRMEYRDAGYTLTLYNRRMVAIVLNQFEFNALNVSGEAQRIQPANVVIPPASLHVVKLELQDRTSTLKVNFEAQELLFEIASGD